MYKFGHRGSSHPEHFVGGEHYTYRFRNGYGASVVRSHGSYGSYAGLYELVVLHLNDLCYASPITSDVVGWLDEKAVQEHLTRIKKLPPALHCSHERPY